MVGARDVPTEIPELPSGLREKLCVVVWFCCEKRTSERSSQIGIHTTPGKRGKGEEGKGEKRKRKAGFPSSPFPLFSLSPIPPFPRSPFV